MAVGLGACSSEDSRPRPQPADRTESEVEAKPKDPCLTPAAGCPCEEEGEVVKCGTAAVRSGDYVTCTNGTRTCENGEWGECVGTSVELFFLARPVSHLGLLGFGSGAKCPEGHDPCDPYCYFVDDTPDGDMDLGEGLTADETGLTLVATGSGRCTDLAITASTTTMTVTGFAPIEVEEGNPLTLTAVASPPSCVRAPFETTWTIDQFDRAAISGSQNDDGRLTLAVGIAGPIQVTAYAAGLNATAQIDVKVNVVEAPSTSTEAAPDYPATTTAINAFGDCSPMTSDCWSAPAAGNTASTVSWLYPYDGTYFPLGLLPPDVQYKYPTAAGANPAVKVSLRYPFGASAAEADFNYSLIVSETNTVHRRYAMLAAAPDPQIRIPAVAWQYFERTARGHDAGLAVQRHKGGSGADQLERESAQRRIHFVDGQLKGTVYYKSYNSRIGGATSTTAVGAILEIAPAAAQPTVAIPSTAGTCSVCHTVNARGTRLFVNSGDLSGTACPGGYGSWSFPFYYDNTCSYDLSSRSHVRTFAQNTSHRGKFEYGAPYPNGEFYLSNAWDNHSAFEGGSALYRASDAAAVTGVTGVPPSAVTPAFAPDGRTVAYNDAWMVVVSEISVCRDFSNAAGEGIELRNDSPGTVNIGGWKVMNGSGATCTTVASGTTLASGATRRLTLSSSNPCLGDTADTAVLVDAEGNKRFTYKYDYTTSCTTGMVKGSALTCPPARKWSTKTSAFNRTSNDTCSGLGNPASSSVCPVSTANPFVAGNLLKAKSFDCGAASGEVDCGTGAWSFTDEETVVDCARDGCDKAGHPSFLPDSTGIVYQHMTQTSQEFCSELNSMYGARAQLWLASKSQPFMPVRLDALNGYDDSGSNYLPTVPRDVSTPTGFNGSSYISNFHSTSATTGWVHIRCSPSGLTAATVKENELNYAPTVSPQEAGGHYWVTFMSRRLYGNVATSSPWQSEMSDGSNQFGSFSSFGGCSALNAYGPAAFIETKKIWIAAIDKDWQTGDDPSHPAFYLPGQELLAGNSHAYWAATPCGARGDPCETNDDCCGGSGTSPSSVCKLTSTETVPPPRQCEPVSSCSAEGQECGSGTDCCTGLTCPEGGGVCLSLAQPLFEPQVLEREYIADCPAGKSGVWRFFEVQMTIPDGASIHVAVQTKATESGDYVPAEPLSVGTAIESSPEGVWARGDRTMDEILRDAGLISMKYLLVTITLEPDAAGLAAPTLEAWRQIYDCIASD